MTGAALLEKQIDVFFNRFPHLKNKNSFAVAVSGGPDSVGCLHMLWCWCKQHSKELHVLTVDHGLREEAKNEAKQVGAWVLEQKNSNLTHHILTWKSDKPTSAIMEKARHARYGLMAEYCKKNNIQTLFVAHHQDDQAETFFIRLAKGSGLDGLSGMVALRDYNNDLKIARPFLNVPKQDIIEYCLHHKLEFAQDSSNENTNFLRPRLRQSMQVLHDEGLTVDRISSLTRRLNRAGQALGVISDKAYDEALIKKNDADILIDFEVLKSHPEEIAFRVVKKCIDSLHITNSYGVRMDKLENLFEDMWLHNNTFKSRTLGGFVFALKDKSKVLYIKKEAT